MNFNLVETDETLEEVKWTRALEMWMFVIMEDAECSAIGRKLRSKHGSDSLKCLRELFGKKASSTVAKQVLAQDSVDRPFSHKPWHQLSETLPS